MNIKRSTLAIAVSALVGLGMAGQAAAGVYAGSRLQIDNLTINITNVGPPGVTGYTFNLDNTATLNGVSATTAGISSTCNSLGSPACSATDPALTAVAANAPGSAPLRVDGAANNWDFLGPGASQTYANSDSEIQEAQLTTGNPTDTIQISEAEVAGTGTGQSSTTVQSNTNFTFTFVIGPGGGSFVLDFDADPDLYVAVDTLGNFLGALAQANTGATFTLTSNTGARVQWSPDGLAGGFTQCAGVTSCTEDNDDESLNNTVGLPAGNPADAGISDARKAGVVDPGLSDFGITVLGLPSGDYSLTLAATSSVNVVQAVPEPAILGLLGLSLAGLGMRRRSRKNT